ncbi:hypothetical protein [Brachybacterium kimchii]|uniref:Uncharacterized protein n=1 Tax=Brachybacterium kimchii TaxID=2942909 RepID=A0ABY4N7X2_9MICO|nr:hypothetical protein [Brachybacterium kimchii]UQN29464.1 hypothetical protein M4486_17795 [Brachybacterium kimchii]
MSEQCAHCGVTPYHYMTHVCADCTCHVTEVRIPGEPHIPAYLDMEPNPECPVHRNTEKENER